MGKDELKGRKKTNPQDTCELEASARDRALVEFQKNVGKKIEDAIVERMKAFREDILKLKIR